MSVNLKSQMQVEPYQSEKEIKTHEKFIRMPTLMGQYKCPIQIGILLNLSVFWSTFLKKIKKKKKNGRKKMCRFFCATLSIDGTPVLGGQSRLTLPFPRRCSTWWWPEMLCDPTWTEAPLSFHHTATPAPARHTGQCHMHVPLCVCLCVHRGWEEGGLYVCVCILHVCVSVYAHD